MRFSNLWNIFVERFISKGYVRLEPELAILTRGGMDESKVISDLFQVNFTCSDKNLLRVFSEKSEQFSKLKFNPNLTLNGSIYFLFNQIEKKNLQDLLVVYPGWPDKDVSSIWPENWSKIQVSPFHRAGSLVDGGLASANIWWDEFKVCCRGYRPSLAKNLFSEAVALLSCKFNQELLSFKVPYILATFVKNAEAGFHIVEWIDGYSVKNFDYSKVGVNRHLAQIDFEYEWDLEARQFSETNAGELYLLDLETVRPINDLASNMYAIRMS